MAIKTVKQYLDKGGHVCKDCDHKSGEIGKCRKHTSVHTIRHMGFWRWFIVFISDPVWTIKRTFLQKKVQAEAEKKIADFKAGRAERLRNMPTVSMIRRK